MFDLDTIALIELAARDRATGASCRTGRKVAGKRSRSSSAPPTRRSIRRPTGSPTKLAAKVAAGAQFAQTQFCMDAGVVRRYLRRGSPSTRARAISPC